MAITLDTSSHNKTTASTTLTVSHTCAAGSQLYLAVNVSNGTGGFLPTLGTPTYNSVSMTQVVVVDDTNAARIALYKLTSPSTGTNTISASFSNNAGSYGFQIVGLSVLGADSIGASASHYAASGNTITATLTTTATNSWIFQNGNTVTSSAGAFSGTGGGTLSTIVSEVVRPNFNYMGGAYQTDVGAIASYDSSYVGNSGNGGLACAMEIKPTITVTTGASFLTRMV